METLQEIVTRHIATIDKAIKLDRGYLEHTKSIKLVKLYRKRFIKLLNLKRFYELHHSDLL